MVTCKFSDKEYKPKGLKYHSDRCKLNPNRLLPIPKTQKWLDAMGTNTRTIKAQKCKYCQEKRAVHYLEKHQNTCLLNPKYEKVCPQCSSKFNTKDNSTTCSHSCANKYFKKNHNNYTNYRTICFHHHKKECVVCKESNIVAVHHYDHNHYNNDPTNLIPMCPTHHQYMHSKFKHLIEDIVNEYKNNLKLKSVENNI